RGLAPPPGGERRLVQSRLPDLRDGGARQGLGRPAVLTARGRPQSPAPPHPRPRSRRSSRRSQHSQHQRLPISDGWGDASPASPDAASASAPTATAPIVTSKTRANGYARATTG